MKIGHFDIGRDRRPFILAELSGNHNGSLETALALVDAVAASGAHGLKLQTYTADTMTLDLPDPAFLIDDPASLWHGRTLYGLYEEAHTPWEWHEPLFRRAGDLGLVAFSTPFDHTAVEFLETLGVPAYKIASFENVDLRLIRTVAATGKPLVISTGMSTLAVIDEAVTAARDAGCRDLILLKCTSSYPASPRASNLRTLSHLRTLFGCEVGLSDHTAGIGAAVAAVALGATVIEKHVTLDRGAGGVDSAFSLEPHELRQLVDETGRAWEALGEIRFGPTEEERGSLKFRRSLYICEDLRPGDTLTPSNVRAIRPGYGLAPRYFDDVVGRKVTRPVARGTPVSWDLLG